MGRRGARGAGRGNVLREVSASVVDSSPRVFIVHRQSPLGPVGPSFRALYGRLKCTVRRHKFDKESLYYAQQQIAIEL